MLRLLNNEEENMSRLLYNEAFSEDSESFVNYYYAEKIKYNRIVAYIEAEAQKFDIRAMLHLNPYKIRFGNREITADYIVAVATALKYQRQGLMRRLLKYIFKLLYAESMPFTFLLPANPAYYKPFQFDFVSDYTHTVLKEEAALTVKAYSTEYETELIDFMQRKLADISEVYCLRDRSYLKQLISELASENGEIELLLDNSGRVAGYRLYWGIKKREDREFLCSRDYAEIVYTAKPYMMARIINLKEFVKAISLFSEDKEDELIIRLLIEDDFIDENNGDFIWRLNKSGSVIEKTKEKLTDCPIFTIDELVSWFFGYKKPACYDKYVFLKRVRCLNKMYINEVV